MITRLVTTLDMYQNLGIHWASSIPAFLALACVPFPFLFYKYGEPIRMKCKYAAEAAAVLEGMRGGNGTDEPEEGEDSEKMDIRDSANGEVVDGEKDGEEKQDLDKQLGIGNSDNQ